MASNGSRVVFEFRVAACPTAIDVDVVYFALKGASIEGINEIEPRIGYPCLWCLGVEPSCSRKERGNINTQRVGCGIPYFGVVPGELFPILPGDKQKSAYCEKEKDCCEQRSLPSSTIQA